ncbi:MAG: HEAT repeat domain-containing protein [Candidatus Sericytochromatia bacterium]
MSALAALRTLGDYAAIPALVACLKADPDPEVRATAAEVSRRLTEDRANPRDPYGIFGL